MNRRKRSTLKKGNIFLLEIVLDLLLFSILLTVCLHMFMKAHNLTKTTDQLYQAVNACENVADLYEAGSGDLSLISANYLSSIATGSTIYIYFDADFREVAENDALYIVSGTIADPETVAFRGSALDITCSDTSGNEIYTVRACHFEQALVGERMVSE